MASKIAKWVGIAAGIATILMLIFFVVSIKGENTELAISVAQLGSKVQEKQSELDGLRTVYHSMLVTLITEGRITVTDIEPFLSENEVQEVEERVPVPALSLPLT